jgi:oligoribonuclease
MTCTHPARVTNLYADLETTGLDTDADELVEVAVIGTNADLDELFRGTWLTRPSAAGLAQMYGNKWIRETDTANGIFADLTAAHAVGPDALLTVPQIEDELMLLLGAHGGLRGKVSLSGSGVAEFDKVFLARLMPTLMGELHYRTTDVGYLRRSYLAATEHNLTEVNDTKTHRALDDVVAHLAEERTFRDLFRAHYAAQVAA